MATLTMLSSLLRRRAVGAGCVVGRSASSSGIGLSWRADAPRLLSSARQLLTTQAQTLVSTGTAAARSPAAVLAVARTARPAHVSRNIIQRLNLSSACRRAVASPAHLPRAMPGPALMGVTSRTQGSTRSAFTAIFQRTMASSTSLAVIKRRMTPVLYTLVAAAALGAVGVLVWRVSSFMGSLTFVHVTYFGFYLGGMASTLLLVVGALLWRKYRGLHPESLKREAMRRITNTTVVRDKLGSEVLTGDFRAYAPAGGFIIDTSKVIPRFRYEPVSLQMMFQLHGDKDSAMCSVSAHNLGGDHRITTLALDFTDGKRYILAGKPEDVVFKGLTKLR